MDKYKNLTVKDLKGPIQVPTEFEDIPHQYCSNIVQHITTASEEEDAFIFEHISSYVNGVMQHEGITKIPKRLLERALVCFKEEHKEEWDVLMGIEENKDKAFHCGFEESGGHAYNCNDCPNKCEEWHQWDKEFKEDKE